jgi:thiamine monophosphate synthase
MATLQDRIQAAWDTGDPRALHREVERLAAEGHSQQALEDALEALLLAVRKAGASDATEETINGVWDRLTAWGHAGRHIGRKNAPAPIRQPLPTDLGVTER